MIMCHVVLLLAQIKLDYNLTSTSWHSSSGLRGRRRTYRTILEWAEPAKGFFKSNGMAPKPMFF
jgi:hypothetical protein